MMELIFQDPKDPRPTEENSEWVAVGNIYGWSDEKVEEIKHNLPRECVRGGE